MIKKYDFKFDIPTITIIMYALYAIKCVWLAFASLDYSPIFYYIMQIPLALCLVFGLLMFLTDKVELPENKFLIILPFYFFIFSLSQSKENINYAQSVFTLVIVMFFIFFKTEIKISIFNTFYWLIQACNVISILFFLLNLMHINLGFEQVNYYSETINASYIKWGGWQFIKALLNCGYAVSLMSLELWGLSVLFYLLQGLNIVRPGKNSYLY